MIQHYLKVCRRSDTPHGVSEHWYLLNVRGWGPLATDNADPVFLSRVMRELNATVGRGVGPAMSATLEDISIMTMRDLQRLNVHHMIDQDVFENLSDLSRHHVYPPLRQV